MHQKMLYTAKGRNQIATYDKDRSSIVVKCKKNKEGVLLIVKFS